MAERAVELGYRLMKGETLANPVQLIPSELITRDNVDQYPQW